MNNAARVLIVDDEPWNLEVLESFLQGEDYRIIRAANGEEALNILNKEPVDLVLLDVMMPGFDGYGVCKKIKEQEMTKSVPVIMVTSLDGKSARIVAARDGADDFITKPVDKAELLIRARSLIRIKRLHDQLEDKHLEIKRLQTLKGNLTRMMEDDFKNTLAGITGCLNLISTSIKDGQVADSREPINEARHLSEKLCSMVQDLLDLLKTEK